MIVDDASIASLHSTLPRPCPCRLASASGDGTACVWHVPHRPPAYTPTLYLPHPGAGTGATTGSGTGSGGTSSASGSDGLGIPVRPFSVALHTPASYVYCASFHPRYPQLLVTGAFDGGVRLWDTRVPASGGAASGSSAVAAAAAGVDAAAGASSGSSTGGTSRDSHHDGDPAAVTPSPVAAVSASSSSASARARSAGRVDGTGIREAVLLGYIGGDPRAAAPASVSGGGLGGTMVASTATRRSAIIAGAQSGAGGVGVASGPGRHTAHVNAIEWETSLVPLSTAPASAAGAAGAAAALASGGAVGGGPSGGRAMELRVKRLITADGAGGIIFWEVPGAATTGTGTGSGTPRTSPSGGLPPLPFSAAAAAAAAATTASASGSLEASSDPAGYRVARDLRPSVLRGVGVTSVRVRPGNSSHVAVLAQSNVLRLFDTSTYGAIRAFPSVHCLGSRIDACFSADGKWLLAGSEDGVLALWDADSGHHSQVRAFIDEEAATAAAAASGGGKRALVAFPGVMYGAAWHPHQHLVAVCAFGGAYPVMLVGSHGSGAAVLAAAAAAASAAGDASSGGGGGGAAPP